MKYVEEWSENVTKVKKIDIDRVSKEVLGFLFPVEGAFELGEVLIGFFLANEFVEHLLRGPALVGRATGSDNVPRIALVLFLVEELVPVLQHTLLARRVPVVLEQKFIVK